MNASQQNNTKKASATEDDRGIEDVEQGAIDELLGRRPDQNVMYNDSIFGWTWADNKADAAPKSAENTSRPAKRDQTGFSTGDTVHFPNVASSDSQFTIDPITNRKVFKNSTSKMKVPHMRAGEKAAEIPVKTFKGYRPQFSKYEPPSFRTTPNIIHLGKSTSASSTPYIDPSFGDPSKDLPEYIPYKYNEPDGKAPESDDKGLNDFDHQYRPYRYNEPDGLPTENPDPTDRCLDEFDHDHPYQPFKYREPDGKLPEEAESPPAIHLDGDPVYRPYTYNEPDGLPTEKPNPAEEGLSDYDRMNYSLNAMNDAITSKWLAQEGFGKESTSGSNQPIARSSVGETGRTSGQGNAWSTLQKAKSNATEAERAEDIDLLRASDIRASSGILKGPRPESEFEKSNRRVALEAEFQAASNPASDEMQVANESIKQRRERAAELELEASYLLNHNAHARSRVNAKLEELDAELAKEGPAMPQQKLTGNFVKDFPEEFKASWKSTGAALLPERHNEDKIENTVQAAENDYAASVSAQESSEPGKRSERLETSLQRSLGNNQNADAKTSEDPYSKEPVGLETGFASEKAAREDGASPMFTSSYGCEKQRHKERELVKEIRDIYESAYGTIDSRHRQVPVAAKIAEETTQEEMLAMNNTGAEAAAPAPASAESTSMAAEPNLYKILAYDPSTQSISFAETSSIAADNAKPLTPAQVLLTLNNPAKFLPHFKPLQAQGYEIASGAGDVLVFRKVRDGSPAAVTTTAGVTEIEPTKRKVVNPIDGMSAQSMPDNFSRLSPTGFVNHDAFPSSSDAEPSSSSCPKFISGIDVRREEPVFSGRRNWEDEAEKPRKKGRGKGLLIGAAWVAGCSYAVGVVAEFFRTGGVDGKGPQEL